MTIDEILTQLANVPERTYPREALDAALAQREAIVPQLLAIVDEVTAAPESKPAPADFRFVFALMLLGYFKIPAAHERLVRLCRFTEKQLDCWLGDLLTEDFPALLVLTYDGDSEPMMQVALDPAVYLYARLAAFKALVVLAGDGALARGPVIAMAVALLERAEAADNEDEIAAELAIDAFMGLHPGVYLTRLTRLLELGLADPYMTSPEDLQEAADATEADCSRNLRRQCLNRLSNDDFHKWTSWWACFRSEQDEHAVADAWGRQLAQSMGHRTTGGGGRQTVTRTSGSPGQSKKSKEKRNAAKASRRRNRKK